MSKNQTTKNIIKHTFLRYIYTGFIVLSLPLLLFVFRKKLIGQSQNLSHRHFRERFGILCSSIKSGGLHIHCVSVGELNAASGLINQILHEYPSINITLTTSSTSGAEQALKMFGDKVQHSYLPFDIPIFMGKFYRTLVPSIVLITEVEVWPNQIAYCKKNGIKTILINARMSNKSLINSRRLGALLRPSLRSLDLICAQSTQSYENFLKFGVYKPQIKLSRNMKFDLLPEPSDQNLGQSILQASAFVGRPILVAGSTHSPEEKLILDVFSALRDKIPRLALIIAPRHPQRFEQAFQICKASGIRSVCWTKLQDKKSEYDCLLLDQIGMLKACYSVCSLAFVGGSIAEKGGHNALEPAVYGKPMVMGPSRYNNPSICEYLEHQGALKLGANVQQVYDCLLPWLQNKELAEKDGANGARVLLRNAGSVEYTMSVLRPYLQNIPAK